MAQPGFNISTFRSVVNKSGVMRNNKFLVRIPMPYGMTFARTGANGRSRLEETARHLEVWCESTNIPGVSLSTNEIRRYGYGNVEKKPYVPVINDVNFSFISDGKGEVWTFFQQWLRMISNYDMRNGIIKPTGVLGQTPFELSYKYQYVSDIELFVFDETGKVVLALVLREAYPIFVGDVQLNWGDTNNIARIPVTMTVYDWYNVDRSFDQVDTSGSIRPDGTGPVQITASTGGGVSGGGGGGGGGGGF